MNRNNIAWLVIAALIIGGYLIVGAVWWRDWKKAKKEDKNDR